jgi:hypothetical protein
VSGYVRPRTIKLTWADGEFAGLEIRARRVSIETFFDLAPLIEGGIDASHQEGRKELLAKFQDFGRVLVSWNLEDEDEHGNTTPIPCTAAEFMQMDPKFVREVLDQWAEAVAGVADPLDAPSPGGEPFQEASLPMETLSPSLVS